MCMQKWTRRKFEIATGEMYNPIKQDVKHGKLRNYKHGDMMLCVPSPHVEISLDMCHSNYIPYSLFVLHMEMFPRDMSLNFHFISSVCSIGNSFRYSFVHFSVALHVKLRNYKNADMMLCVPPSADISKVLHM